MTVRIGLLGLGTVGGGVVKLLRERREDIRRRLGVDLELAMCCALEDGRLAELGVPRERYTRDVEALFAARPDILVEVAGGPRFKDVIRRALDAGMSVVTANKSLLSAEGTHLMGSPRGMHLHYEASCMGGVPIISSLEEGLQANEIQRLYGILNGTTNFILTEMAEKGGTFDKSLKNAQAKGYAEADPTFDVDGIDATHKLSLLASLAFRLRVPCRLLPAEGIRELDPGDFTWARANRHAIKLIAMAERGEDGRCFLGTFPALVPETLPLAHIRGAMNAIMVWGKATGELMYSGAGAGEMPTASAVLADVVAAAQGRTRVSSHQVFSAAEELAENRTDRLFSFYIRMATPDRTGMLAKLCGELAAQDISLKMVDQEPLEGRGQARLVFMTHPTRHDAVKAALAAMAEKKYRTGHAMVLRLLEGGAA